MADNSLLHGTYSMLIQGFIQGGLKNPAKAPDPPPGEVVLETIPYPNFNIPEAHFPNPEAPVIAGYLPSQQFPAPAGADWPPYRVQAGYRPAAGIAIIKFDGKGGLQGNMIGTIGGRVAFNSGPDFFPAVNEVALYPQYSNYQVDPAGTTARMRLTWNFGSGDVPDFHVIVVFLTILKSPDEMHYVVLGAGEPVVYSGVMKKTWSKE